ncbi:spermidine synthase [Lachnospira sp.]|uniref:spermidine synthase n=1 Tax=Lachnospira sp. TaxID=2049031 RepID=UPI00257C80E7|nr:fused MFS/spermidine synthase [Lachnospira sp.]
MKNYDEAKEKNLYATKSRGYGKIMVRDQLDDNGEEVRYLLVNYQKESAMFKAPEKRDELCFAYTKQFANAFMINSQIKDSLLIGGAAFSYPKYYLSHYPEARLDVVEINPEMLEIAKKYFYLEDYIKMYAKAANGADNGRLGIHIQDGMQFLAACEKNYDLIINDAYIGASLDSGLMSYRGVAQIKRHLNAGGIYMVNIITALTGFFANDLKKAREVFGANFKNVYVYPVRPDLSSLEKQNCILIGTDLEIPKLDVIE